MHSSVKLHVSIGKYWVLLYVLVCMVNARLSHMFCAFQLNNTGALMSKLYMLGTPLKSEGLACSNTQKECMAHNSMALSAMSSMYQQERYLPHNSDVVCM